MQQLEWGCGLGTSHVQVPATGEAEIWPEPSSWMGPSCIYVHVYIPANGPQILLSQTRGQD